MELTRREIRNVTIFREAVISYVSSPHQPFDALVEIALSHLGPEDATPVSPSGWFAIVINDGNRVIERELGRPDNKLSDMEILMRANTVMEGANLL